MNIWIGKKDEKLCRDCKHFRQHYVLCRGEYSACYAGHCVYPRVKAREPYDSCRYFETKNAPFPGGQDQPGSLWGDGHGVTPGPF